MPDFDRIAPLIRILAGYGFPVATDAAHRTAWQACVDIRAAVLAEQAAEQAAAEREFLEIRDLQHKIARAVDEHAVMQSATLDRCEQQAAELATLRAILADIAAATSEQGALFFDADGRDDWPAAIAWLRKHISLSPEASMLEQHAECVNGWRAECRAERQRADRAEAELRRALAEPVRCPGCGRMNAHPAAQQPTRQSDQAQEAR